MTTARTFLLATIAAGLVGCGSPGLSDATFPTGTSVIAASSSQRALFVANPDQGNIARLDLDSGDVTELSVGEGSEPTRIARVNDKLIVPLRGQRGIAVVDEADFTVLSTIPTGAEPYGVVAREDGTRFYVTISQDGTVQEYDGETLELLRTFEVGADVRWMALHPNNQSLYVASPFGGDLFWIDLDSGVVTPVDIPTVVGNAPETGDEVPLTPRITGDISISPDGRQLAIPMMNVENNAPGGDLSAPNPSAAVYYAPPGGGRFNSTVLTTSVISGGAPSDEFWEAILLNVVHDNLGTIASYPSSVTWAPNSDQLLLTVEAGEAVVSVPGRYQPLAMSVGRTADRRNDSGQLLLQVRPTSAVKTSEGPRGIAFVDDNAFVYSYFEGLIEDVKANDMAREYDASRGGPAFSGGNADAASAQRMYTDQVLSAYELAGRALFYSSTDDRVAFNGAGVSCSTCHFEGRNDGLSWPLEQGARQTPSLAGGTSDTEPVTWALNVPTAADEAFATSQGRMGGRGLSVADSQNIAAFINTFRSVDVADRDADEATLQRGAEAYVQAGCDDCHSGHRMTDNESYRMLGLDNVNTPPLTGIAATAPYFHDGSAATLREVLEFSRSGEMGDTSSLSETQMADLETYLRSL